MSAEEHPHETGACGQDAAPYVLGALTDAEQEAFLAHLQTCTICREEVTALQAVANSLPAAVPQLNAPPELRGRVMATVRSEAALRRAGAERIEPRRRRSRPAPWLLGFGGLATTAAVVLVALLAFGGSGGSRAPSVKVYRARVTAPSGAVSLRVSSGHGQLQISGLPQSPRGRVYEVWVERAGHAEPTDALFTVSLAGDATVAVPGSLAGVRAVMATAEPRGGSRVPSRLPVFVAKLT